MTIDIINMAMKNSFFNIFSMLISLKIINYKELSNFKKIIVVLFCIIFSGIYVFVKQNIDIVMAVFVIYLLQVIFLKLISKKNILTILLGNIISTVIPHIVFLIATTLEYIIQSLLQINSTTINMFITLNIELILICLILKFKRLKNGLIFLQKADDYLGIAVVNICILTIVMYGLVGNSQGNVIKHRYFYFIILGTSMLITVQKMLVMHYKQKLIDDTINDYKKQLQEKDNEIKKLTDEAFRVSRVTHEFYNRQKSLELMVKKKLENFNVEMAEDFDVLDRIHQITAEHSERINDIKSVAELPVTNIEEIDNMFEYMQSECMKYGINFKLMVNGNINYLVNNLIPKNKLETLIGDHIRDAIIAVNSSDRAHKEIFVVLGVKDNCYELCIYDTGIEFEIDTLLKLGLMPITTHKDSGGSGIGFITTFETLKECKASLIIEEKNSGVDNDYTKAVIIRFDGENEYRISSYRASEIKKNVKDNRIKII